MNSKYILGLALLLTLGMCHSQACQDSTPSASSSLTSEPEAFPCEQIDPSVIPVEVPNQDEANSQDSSEEFCAQSTVTSTENANGEVTEETSSERAWSYNGERHASEERTDQNGCLHLIHRWIDANNLKHEVDTWTDKSGNSYELSKWEDGDGCTHELHEVVDSAGHFERRHLRRDQHGVVTQIE